MSTSTASRMRLHPVNPAESVIAAFFDPGLSPVDEWVLEAGPSTKGLRKLHSYTISYGWDHAAPGVPAFLWSWEGELDVGGYDGFFLQAGLPSTATLRLEAKLDGKWRRIAEGAGCDTHDDYGGSFSGALLQALRIEVVPSLASAGAFATYYLGVHSSRKLEDWLAYENPTAYPRDWPEFIKPEAEWGAWEPCMGISFGPEDLPALASKIDREPYRGLAQALRLQASEDWGGEPERRIRRYLPCGPQPYAYSARQRDRGLPFWTIVELAAFFGLVDRDPELIRKAARYLVSMCHVRWWTESFVEHDFPGSAVNWRSFYQNLACLAAASALDWIGFALTDHAKEVVRHSIFFKGLAPIEYDFARHEYIYHMNQAVVFSYGRIASLLALSGSWPRTSRELTLAHRDLDETSREIIAADGGYGEGPGYYSGVMFYMLGAYLLLSRFLGVDAVGLMPPGVRRGADYFGTFVATSGQAARLPLSDGGGTELPSDWIAMFARVTGDARWTWLLGRRLESDMSGLLDGVINRTWAGSSIRTLIWGPEELGAREPMVPVFRIHEGSGHATSSRPTPRGPVRLHLSGSSPSEGHSHGDKGAVVLEAFGIVLLTDRGTPIYSDPLVSIIKDTRWHNAVTVESEDGSELTQINPCPTAACPTGSGDGKSLRLVIDVTPAWGPPVQSMLRSVESPDPLHIEVRDRLRLSAPRRVLFHLHSHYPVAVEPGGKGALFTAPAVRLRVTWRWAAEVVQCGEDLTDGEKRPVYHLAMRSEESREHDLITELEVL